MLDTFRRAQADDPDALYAISQCYKNGSNGFPQSDWRATACRNNAAILGHKGARAERAYEDYHRYRIGNLEKSLAAQRELWQLKREGVPYAIWAVEQMDQEMAEYNRRRARIDCSYCKGSGHDPDYVRVIYFEGGGSERKPASCRFCNGTGRKDKRPWYTADPSTW